jgi:hypothetical protein
MIIRNITEQQMQQALDSLNKQYNGNIKWKRFDVKPYSIHFTLTVIDSSKEGGRRSPFDN